MVAGRLISTTLEDFDMPDIRLMLAKRVNSIPRGVGVRGLDLAGPKSVAVSMAIPKRNMRFRPGRSGACEASLFEFTGKARDQESPPVERVAACEIDEALLYMRRYHPHFEILRVELVTTMVMISGSPLN